MLGLDSRQARIRWRTWSFCSNDWRSFSIWSIWSKTKLRREERDEGLVVEGVVAGVAEGMVEKGLERRWERKRENVRLGLGFWEERRLRRGRRVLRFCAICD